MQEHRRDVIRKLVHMAMGLFALLLRYLTPWQAALCALAALAHNVWLLPRLWGRYLYRSDEQTLGRVPIGIIAYPLSVLLLILVFGTHPYVVAAAWAMMAFGDGLAGLTGPWVGRVRWPWNPRKTVEGSLAYVGGAFLGSWALLMWTTGGRVPTGLPLRDEAAFFLWTPLAVSLLTAVLEALDLRLNDNLTIPLSAGALLYMAYHVPWDDLAWTPSVAQVLLALGLNWVIGGTAWSLGWVSASGFWSGWVVGVVTFLAGGWRAYLLLLALFVGGSLATRWARDVKAARGLAESPRDWRSAVAKAGLPALLTVWWALAPSDHRAWIAAGLVAAYAAGLMDTVASEVGKGLGGAAFLWWAGRSVPVGTPGAVSVVGTAAGLAAGAGLVGLGAGLWGLPVAWVPWMIVAVAVANFLESFLGHTLRSRGLATAYELNAVLVVLAAVLTMGVVRS
ncbi:Phytol kinase [bacterium HR11]|nr:Phytol kinase [bacterium HR11]